MANQTSEKYTEDLFQAIDTIIANRVSKLPYDQTIICTIENNSQAEYGKYWVKASNSTSNLDAKFAVFSNKTDYKVGDKVYVRIPMGDFTQQKVITGDYVVEGAADGGAKDVFWTAEKTTMSESSALNSGTYSHLNLYDRPAGEVFPGYYAFRLQFTPFTRESFVGTNYTQNQVDVQFEVVVECTIPTTLSTTISKIPFVIKLRDYNANLLRNFSSKITVDIDLYALYETQLQINKIYLQNLKFIGDAAGQYTDVSLRNISYSFGYYISNNINKLLVIYSNDNFYSPDDSQKTIYFHYYDAIDYKNKQLEPITYQGDQFIVSFGDQNIECQIEEDVFNEHYYSITLPIGNNEILNGSLQAAQINVTSGDEIKQNIVLVNSKYYSQVSEDLDDTKKHTRFLTTYYPTEQEEREANFNNGVFYIYGQDGKVMDSSASYITRRAFVKFVDYFTTDTFVVEDLSCELSLQQDPSMITITSTAPMLWDGDTTRKTAYITFKIDNYYAQNKRNNTIIWKYNHNGVIYEYPQELLFGYSGSQGADYSLILQLKDSNGKVVPAILADADTAMEYTIDATLYDYSNQIKSYNASEISFTKVSPRNTIWDLVESTNKISVPAHCVPSTTAGNNLYFGVIKATISKYSIEAFLPIAVSWNKDYILSGPSTITYDITGKKPFASKMPYRLYPNDSTSIPLTVTAEIVLPVAQASDALKSLYPKINENEYSVEFPSAYSTDMSEKPPVVVIKQNGNVRWVQPLYIWQNKYPNSMINGEANKVIIPDKDAPAGQTRTIINTSVGRVLTSGTGMFIGEYGTTTNNSDYGLFAFAQDEDNKVKNTFKLTATGDFKALGDLTLLDGNEPANIGKENLPVYYKDGKPEPIMANIKNDNEQATLKDIVQAILDIKKILSTMTLTTAQQELLNNIKLEIEE